MSGPVIGCDDAWRLAEFYAYLLGWSVVARSEEVPGGWALVRSPDGEHKLEFQREEPFAPPVWPTVAGGSRWACTWTSQWKAWRP